MALTPPGRLYRSSEYDHTERQSPRDGQTPPAGAIWNPLLGRSGTDNSGNPAACFAVFPHMFYINCK